MPQDPGDAVSRPSAAHLSFNERITAIHSQLSNKQKRLARFILDNKYFISFASANQAGEKSAISAPPWYALPRPWAIPAILRCRKPCAPSCPAT